MTAAALLPPTLGEGWGGGGALRVEEPSAKYLVQHESSLIRGFELLTTAPVGIAKLRELILVLSVQGLIVEQDSRDESAVALLTRIEADRARRVANKELRAGKALPPVSDSERSFVLPNGWAWTRLGNLGDWGAGATPSRSRADYYGGNIPWFKSGELTADFISESEEMVTDLALHECSLRANKVGDVLVAMYGATIGKTAILSCEGTTNQAVCACTPFNGFSNQYLLVLLKALRPYFVSIGAGGAQPNISREKLVATVVGLPPLAEQHRIVARVEELMKLCDALEQSGRLADEQHARLTSTLFDALAASESAHALAENWQRIAEHFDLLLDRPEAIAALEQTILQLAVRGLLVPQDVEEISTDEVLRQVRTEKDRLISIGEIKPEKRVVAITDEETPYELPIGWKWVRLSQLLTKIGAGSTPLGGKDVYTAKGVKFLRSQNVWNDGLRLVGVPHIPSSTHSSMSGTVVKPNDLLFNITGASIGRCAQVPAEFDVANVSQHVTIIRPAIADIGPFLHLVMISKHVQQTVMDVQVGVSREGLSIGKLAQFVVPVPPLAEQHRIVARVEEFRRLCAQLRERLINARRTQSQLAEALVAEVAG